MEEAFINAALAMFNILTDINKVKAIKKFSIKVEADTLEKLLFDFLDELLFYLDTEHIIFSSFKDMKISQRNSKYELSCTAYGDIASNYDTHGDIKAPTYNEMSIKKTDQGVVIRAVVDI
jgi:SHS2 domain-containing protein